ncbi:MAG TPA: DUF1232 domain-containing protein [Gaiellales bacterium]|nr:DUF1232 domain-containing protein [Gaiellales bacterium]
MLTLTLIIAVLASLAILWVFFVGAMLILRPRTDLREAVRILPDLLLMLGAIAQDESLPWTIRLRLWLVLFYLAVPIDIVPDVFPVIGWADDAILVAWVVRSVVRRSGTEALARNWRGSADGLDVVKRLAGIRPDPPATDQRMN